MSLKLYRRGPKGEGLETSPVVASDWRTKLRSPRWRAPGLRNPEASPISPASAAALLLALALITFVLIVAGYGVNFWHA